MTNYTKLEAKYKKLTSLEQDCLTIYTLAMEIVDLSGCAKILRLYGITTLKEKPLTHKVLYEVLQPLVEHGFIIEHTKTKFQLNFKNHRFCFKKILQDKQIEPFMTAIREIYPIKEESRYSYGNNDYRNYDVGLREMQYALITKNGEAFQEHSKKAVRGSYDDPDSIDFFFGDPLEEELLQLLSIDIQADILEKFIMTSIHELEPIATYESYLLKIYGIAPDNIKLRK